MNDYMKSVIQATSRHGFNPIVGDIQQRQQIWLNWYRGDVNDFHLFNRNVAGKMRKFERQTLNMPKKICEDYTSLIWNENCEITISDEQAKSVVDKVLRKNNFEVQFGQLLEPTFATGMGYMIEYLNNNETVIDFVHFQNGLPLSFDNGRVTALLTLNPFTVKEKDKTLYVTHLTYHYMEDDTYCILHEAYLSSDSRHLGRRSTRYMRYVFEEAELEAMSQPVYDDSGRLLDIQYKVEHEGVEPFFQVLKPNIKNHYDINSPYGVSIYSTMIPTFKIIDTLWDMYQTETNDNRTRIVIDHQLLQTQFISNEATGEGSFTQLFDENETQFLGLPFRSDVSGQKAIEFLQGQLRMEQINAALNQVLKVAGFRAGLGKSYYAFDMGAVYQNEANVIHTNADTFKSKKKHEIIVGEAIEQMVKSILHLEQIAGRYNGAIDDLEIVAVFDDSIVQDDQAELAKVKMLADDGYLPKWYVVSQALKISEQEARAMVQEAETADAALGAQFMDAFNDTEDEV